MYIEPLFEGRRCDADVFLLVVISQVGDFVFNLPCQACTVQCALIFYASELQVFLLMMSFFVAGCPFLRQKLRQGCRLFEEVQYTVAAIKISILFPLNNELTLNES